MDNNNARQSGTNLDPITGAPGAHPVGVGLGAAAGGIAGGIAAGAAVGTVAAGPVGTVVGAASAAKRWPSISIPRWEKQHRSMTFGRLRTRS
jgi:hypothetical protein